jgi:hypothetical protein
VIPPNKYIIYISRDGNNYETVFNDTAVKIQVVDTPPNKLIYVSKDGNNYESKFNGTAVKIQVVDLEKKGNKILYVSKDGTTYQPTPIYNDAAANFLIDYSVAGGDKKVVYLSKDGTTYQPNPIYNDLAKNFLIEFLAAPPIPPIQKLPDDGRPQPEKNANKDANTWKAAKMTDDTALWKVVDDKNINVADQFHSQANAQQYIDYHRSINQKSKTNEPPQSELETDWQANFAKPRTLDVSLTDDDIADPEDTRCKLLDVGNPSAKATIGQGENVLTGGSPRFYINGEYQNVEFEAEILPVENTSQCYLSARSNHEQRKPPGFGGYPAFFDVTPGKKAKMFFKKEETHEQGYSERLATVDIPYKKDEWFKARVRITNIENGKVKMQAWFNDIVTTSYIDEGQIECGNETHPMRKAPPFTGIGESCFLRVNSTGTKENPKSAKVKYRNIKIRL